MRLFTYGIGQKQQGSNVTKQSKGSNDYHRREIRKDLVPQKASAYFDQARNGITVRKAILTLLLGVTRE